MVFIEKLKDALKKVRSVIWGKMPFTRVRLREVSPEF